MSSTFEPVSRSLVVMTFLPLSLLTRKQQNANRKYAFTYISNNESGNQYKYMKYSRQNLIFMTPQHQFKFFDVFYSFYSFNDSLSYIMIDYEMSSSIFSRPKHCGKSGSKTLFLFNTKLLFYLEKCLVVMMLMNGFKS